MENRPTPFPGDGENYSLPPANALPQTADFIRGSLLSLHQVFPSLVSKDLLDNGRSHRDVLQAVSHAKDVLLRHVDQFEAVETLLLQLGAHGPQAEQAQHQRVQEGSAGELGEQQQQQQDAGTGQGIATAPQLSLVPLASTMPPPGPSIATSAASSDSQVFSHMSRERTANLHQPHRGRVPPSRGSSSSSFYGVRPSPSRASSSSSFLGLHHHEHVAGDVSSTSRLATSIAALAQAQQQQQQQQQRPSPPFHHLQPPYPHTSNSSSSLSLLPSGSSNTSGLDSDLMRILSLEPSFSDLSPTSSSTAGAPSNQPLSQGVITPAGARMSPAAVQAAPGTAAAAAAAAAGMPTSSVQVLHKQPRRVHSSLPYQWHAIQRNTAPTPPALEHPHSAIQAWPSMAPLSTPLLGTNTSSIVPTAQLALYPPAQHNKPQRHQSFGAVGLLQQHQPLQQATPLTQHQQQQLLLLSQLAKQQQQQQQQQRPQTHSSVPGPPQVLPRNTQQRPGSARLSLGSRPAALKDGGSVGPLLLSQVDELQQPMPALGLGTSGPMATHVAGNLQNLITVSGGVDGRAAGLEGDCLVRRGASCGGAHPIMAGQSHGSAGPRPQAGFGGVGTSPGTPVSWGPGGSLGVVEKKEGNKRSGASRRRKAKMYQSLNAMVQSVLDDDSHADMSAATVLASNTAMLSDPLLYQGQLLAVQQQQQQQQQQHHHFNQQQQQQQQQPLQAKTPDAVATTATLGASSAPSSKDSSAPASGEGAGLYSNLSAGLQGSVGLAHGPCLATDSTPAAVAAAPVAYGAAVEGVLARSATEPPFPSQNAPHLHWQQPDRKHPMPESQAHAQTL